MGRAILVEGIEYPSLRDAARAYNFDPEKFSDRIRRNWTPEEALEYGMVDKVITKIEKKEPSSDNL